MMSIPITSEFIELAALLKLAGIGQTGGHAKLLIQEGNVRVDGEVVTRRRAKVHPGATIEVTSDVTHRFTVVREAV